MSKTPADGVVEFLRFASDPANGLSRIRCLSDRKWRRCLTWLDDSGLALYFFDKLKRTHSTHTIPLWVLSQLEQRQHANQARVSELSKQFAGLNRFFQHANVQFAVVKGFSLVPQYCPHAGLRHQGDLDYLIDAESIEAAERIVLEAGYSPKPRRSSQELVFVKSGDQRPSRGPEQYSPHSPHAVELHLNMWNSDEHPLPEVRNFFSPARTQAHHWNGLCFPALSDGDAFLLQILHACQHLFTYWIRMSSLYEIGFFLHHHASDELLQNQLRETLGEDDVVREFVVLVSELSSQLFAVTTPEVIQEWAREIRPAVRTWIDHYSRAWAFSEVPAYEFRLLPTAKLVLFLHQQYIEACRDKQLLRTRLIRPARVAKMAAAVRAKPSLLLNRVWWRRQLLVRRSLFHAMAGLRYVLEIPRWKWLNRTRTSDLGRLNAQRAGTKSSSPETSHLAGFEDHA